MIPTFNIISFADSQLLYVILNGVAMICKQTAFIWSVASLAGTIQIILMSTKATIEASSGGGAILVRGWMNIFAAFMLALTLTSPALKGTVTTENIVTGQQTSIDNVPGLISVVPFVASSMADTLGGVIETAFQGSNAQAPYLASRGNGFLNPLKTLLSARGAIDKLPGITSQINSVVSQCLDSASSVDYAKVNALVMNAGNTSALGATAAQSIQVSNSSGAASSIGALLYQVSQNTTSFVTDIPTGLNENVDALSCANAANQVAANINAALTSPAFGVSVGGSVSSADTPNPVAYTIERLDNVYLGIRQSSSVLNTLASGVDQANTEMLNLLFQSVVKDNLDCLKADGVNKVQCLATMELRKATEQSNMDNSSSGQLAMQFAGQFGNYMLALIIGLSPVMILFMMFKGVNAGKSITVAVHMIVWPYLVSNVGGALINGMIYYNAGNFMASMGQGGFINQMSAGEIYRNFSMQIGAASAMMATLPVLMTTIFALSESAAVVSLGAKMSGADHFDEALVAPNAVANSAMTKSGEMMSSSVQLGGGSINKMTGAFDGVASAQSFGSTAREISKSTNQAIQDSAQHTSAQREVSDWKEAFKSGDYSRLGVSTEIGRQVRDSYESKLDAQKSSEQTLARGESTKDSLSAGMGGEIGVGMSGLNLGVSGGLKGQHETSYQLSTQASEAQVIREADSLSTATDDISKTLSRAEGGSDAAHSLERSSGLIKEFVNSSSHLESSTLASSEAIRTGEGFVAESNKIGSQELAFHSANNRRYKQFLDQSTTEMEFGDANRYAYYRELSNQDMSNDVIARATNPYARNAILSHRAMVRMAQDPNLKSLDRLAAQGYLAREGLALSGLSIGSAAVDSLKTNTGNPLANKGDPSGLLVRASIAGRPVRIGRTLKSRLISAESSDQNSRELSDLSELEDANTKVDHALGSEKQSFIGNLEKQKTYLQGEVDQRIHK